jgi:hypothetical protein
MSSATERHRARVQALINTPIEGEVMGEETSDQVKTYLPLAAGLISEVTASQLKKKEDEEKKKKLESGEAFLAQKAATEAQKKAAMAQADAITEADPNGPKHRAAAALALEAQAAQQKAMYHQMQSMATTPGAQPMLPAGYVPPQPSIFTSRNVLIGAGVLGGVAILALLLRRK